MSSDAMGSWDALKTADPDVYAAIEAEEVRQREKLLLIASENFASPAVLAAQGSLLTNKYAEGYPGKRYYGGCQHADAVEDLAIQRCKEIFGAEHVNVQPHSGSQANMAAYLSVPWRAYSARFLTLSPSISWTASLAARSNSDLDVEKFKNLQE